LAIIIADGIFPQKYPNSYFKNIGTRPFFNDEPSYDSKLWKKLVDIILSKILKIRVATPLENPCDKDGNHGSPWSQSAMK
jgi:hypothetical protein